MSIEENKEFHADNDLTFSADNAETLHPADVAEQLENLSLESQVNVLLKMPAENAADALAELDETMAGDVLEHLDSMTAAQIIAEMDPDDAADVLDELDAHYRNQLFEHLDAEDSEELRQLLLFDPDSAAGVMNTDVILLEEDWTADQAIAFIRKEMEEKECPYYAYVVDQELRLVGVLSLRELMLEKPGKLVKDAIASSRQLITARYDLPKNEVAMMLSHYHFMALPIVDNEMRIMGVVTYDDVVDIIHDEASADLLGMVGADPEESTDTPWLESVKKRLPWLAINLVNSAFSAFVVSLFEGGIAQMAALAVLMPIIANQSGNTGQQALAVMIRQLATERFDAKKAWVAVLREVKICSVTGALMALLAFIGAYFFTGMFAVGLVMAIALLCDMLLGAIAGGSIPLILRSLGRDPAQASSIFLTTITDSCGFFFFLGLATLFIL